MYFVFTKGAKTMLSSDDWDMGKSAWVAAIIAGAAATLTLVVVLPLLARRSRARFGTHEE
jgi:ABC-type Fe3+ transport system permease subunit